MMDWIFPRRRRDGDGCGDAAVPSDLRPTTETTKTRARDDATRREGGGATTRDESEWRVMKAQRDGGGLQRR